MIVLGASGSVGNALVKELFRDGTQFKSITVAEIAKAMIAATPATEVRQREFSAGPADKRRHFRFDARHRLGQRAFLNLACS